MDKDALKKQTRDVFLFGAVVSLLIFTATLFFFYIERYVLGIVYIPLTLINVWNAWKTYKRYKKM